MSSTSNSPRPSLLFNPGTWEGTLRLIRSDLSRVYAVMEDSRSPLKRLFWCLFPNCQAMIWYRLSRCLYLKGWKTLAWVVHLMANYLFRAEIPPTTAIGSHCLLGHANGFRLVGVFGRHVTFMGGDGGTGGMGADDESGCGEPTFGDHVVLGVGAMVLGPVRIGHGVRIGPRALVTESVPDHALVLWSKPRVMAGAATGAPLF